MTSSNITHLPTATGSGTDNTTRDATAASEHGIHRVHEQLVYHVTSLAQSVLYEAERLMTDLNKTASKRTIDPDGTKGTSLLDMSSVLTVVSETLDCIDVASEQLSRLNVDIRMRIEPENAP
jgi:hypothetical protein